MFNSGTNNMRPGPTPERVLSLARLVEQEHKGYTENDLIKVIRNNDLEIGKGEEIRSVIKVALELMLIVERNGIYIANDKCSYAIKSYMNFRQYVSNFASSQPESLFFRFTELIIKANALIFDYPSASDLASYAQNNGILNIKEQEVYGWRFWFRFLGFGYLSSGGFIPNMKIRIEDAIKSLKRNQYMDCFEFIGFLQKEIPEIAFIKKNDVLPMAVSNGLRTLHTLGIIQLEDIADAKYIVLYNIQGEEFNKFSGVNILGDNNG